MKLDYDFWKTKLTSFNLNGLDLVRVKLIDDSRKITEQYKIFEQNRERFIKYVAKNNVKDLQIMKILRTDIVKMHDGIMPENAVLIFKILPEYGGEANESNILFMPLHPYNDSLIQFFHMQMKECHWQFPEVFYALKYEKTVFYPNFFLKSIASSSRPERIENMER